jgi:hypothetical protein
MCHTPAFLLQRFQRPMLLGMGGGYDVFAGLPAYFDYVSLGKHPVLAKSKITTLE